ncbi:MAG: hypothetical protein GY793_09215 [Proteobacteria bacterium]|nr:hypothetical protein [Pseudomonadota bacterium]
MEHLTQLVNFFINGYLTLSILTVFLITFFLGPVIAKHFKKLLDVYTPVKRQHKGSTPTAGGLIFVPVIVTVSILFVFNIYSSFNISLFLLVMFICSIAVAVIGFRDDKKEMHPKARLVIHFMAVLLPMVCLPQIWPGINLYLEKAVLAIGWVWFLNLYNFCDGIDGYASIEGIVISLVGAALAPALAPLFLVMAMGLTGFLRVNLPRPKAKIFMGDVGSTFIGYVLGGLMYAALTLEGSLAFSFFTIVMLFSMDATQTLIKRTIRKQKPLMKAHQEHWFARMYALNFSHKKILTLGLFVNLALVIIVALTYNNDGRYLSPVLGMVVFTILAVYVKYYEKKQGIKPLGFRNVKEV